MTAVPELPAPPSAEALRRVLDGRWAAVKEEVRAAAEAGELSPAPSDLTTEEHRAHTTEQLLALAATGRPRSSMLRRYGGGEDVGGSTVAYQTLGAGDLSLFVKAGVQFGLFASTLQALGTRRHHDRYLRSAMDAELLGCFAMTETGHGSDVQQLRTTATYDPTTEEFVVTTPDDAARKDYIGNAARDGHVAIVFCQLVTQGRGHGVHALLVPIRNADGRLAPGVRIEDCGRKMGLNGVDNGRLWFDDVRVPRDALLDRFATVAPDGTYSSPVESADRRFFTMLGTLVRGRVSVAGGAIAATERALALAVRYGDARRQFRRPGSDDEVVLLDYRAHQRRLLPALATTVVLHLAQEALVVDLHELQTAQLAGAPLDEDRQRWLETRAAGHKAVATWHASRTIQTCREACGGAGYLEENLLPRLKADTDVFTTFEGDNTVLLQLVAKGLLSRYGAEVKGLDALGSLRFFADQLVSAVVERTAARGLVQRLAGVVPGSDGDARLLDRQWHLALLGDRERHLVDTLARRLRPAAGGGAGAFDVFNAAQDHLLLAARAHVARVTLEAAVATVEQVDDPAVRALLERVLDLHVLSDIEADRGWFLEHERLAPERSKAVTAQVGALCAALRPHARLLVDAFGVPEAWLDAPIARAAAVRATDGAAAGAPAGVARPLPVGAVG